ncbi:transposable element Tc3 transposase [Trichonephila clavipes]|nr:transposable element Tc3 transposase [Trichonephila clavipes]
MEIPLRTAYGQAGRCGMQPKPSSLRAQAHQTYDRFKAYKTLYTAEFWVQWLSNPRIDIRACDVTTWLQRSSFSQVIYSQFGLAIHQNDHQARRRFVEWAQNEIAVVPDFHKRILFSDKTHFWLNGYVNKQNCRIWSEANPQVYVVTPLHPGKIDCLELWFQQDGATCHTARATIDLLKDTFGDRLISRFGPVNWPPRSCDLTPLDYFLWGYVKSLVYADKPQTLDHLEDNIRRVIADMRPQMLEKVIENWTSRLDYIRASRGSRMPEIIFKILPVQLEANTFINNRTEIHPEEKEEKKVCSRLLLEGNQDEWPPKIFLGQWKRRYSQFSQW